MDSLVTAEWLSEHINDPDLAHFSYQRYIENQIRARHPFTGSPVEMIWKRSSQLRD